MQRKQKMRLSQLALVPYDKDEKGPRREEEIAKYRASAKESFLLNKGFEKQAIPFQLALCPVCLDFRLMNKKERSARPEEESDSESESEGKGKWNSFIFFTRPRCPSFGPKARPHSSKLAPLVGGRGHFPSSAKDSIQPQVPLRLPCYDFTPVEDPTVV
ncbi:hypothetical protein Lal_00042273 [Lupinus albus]|nr:hypothetical protein Lal_00042273 [Lupinus albus]